MWIGSGIPWRSAFRHDRRRPTDVLGCRSSCDRERPLRADQITPGLFAGTVEVRERRSDGRATQVDVTYDLSALSPHGAAKLDDFAAGYEQEIGAR
jgi:hypothetical protein